jgi:hypothetical protein
MHRAELSPIRTYVFVFCIVTVLALTKTSYIAISAMASLVLAVATLIYGKGFVARNRPPEPPKELDASAEDPDNDNPSSDE